MRLPVRHSAPPSLRTDEVGRAWLRYLQETRCVAEEEYAVAEERAWNRLVSNLDAIGAPLEPPARR